MSKYTKTKTPVVPTEVNKMGESAFKLSAKEELVATVLTTFLQKSYYETENEIVNRIRASIDKVDPLFAAKTAIYARNDANMRSVTHLIAGELAKRIAGKEWNRRFYQKVCVRPDDMVEITSYFNNVILKSTKIKLTAAMKDGFRSKIESMDPYLIDKYRMDSKEVSLKDLILLTHPKPKNKRIAEAYKRLIEGKPMNDLYKSKILEKEMSTTGGKNKTAAEVNEAKRVAITSVIDNEKGMPIFNLLRNLRNIILYAPEKVDDACRQLTTVDKIVESRLLPFRFLSAYEEIDKMGTETVSTGVISFEGEQKSVTDAYTQKSSKTKVLNALNEAIHISCRNIPLLAGRTAILIDHSGSMRGDGGGHSLVSAFSRTDSSMIANLFGVMVAYNQPNVFIGLFGDTLINANSSFDRSKGILDNAKAIHALGGGCGGGTEHGIYEFFKEVVRKNERIDNIIVFSDQVIGTRNSWYGRGTGTSSGSFQRLFKEFRKINPACNVVSVDIRQTDGTSVFDKSMNVTQVAGWSDKIFDHIKAGTRGYADLIKEIEAIEI